MRDDYERTPKSKNVTGEGEGCGRTLRQTLTI